MKFAIVGPGRAGSSFARALVDAGWERHGVFGHGDDLVNVATGVDVVLLTVPDDAIAEVASRIAPGDAAILHVSGAKGLDVLAAHVHRGSVHPLMSLPDPETGAERLASGSFFAVAGDDIAHELVRALNGWAVPVPDDRRALYHATAAIAANHLVALCAQVERLARRVDVPNDAYWTLMATTLDNVRRAGALSSLTGPAARGDASTLALHLAALPSTEHDLYVTLASEAARLAGQAIPAVLRTDPAPAADGEEP